MTDPTCQRCGKSLWLHAELDYTGETDIAVCEGDMKEENKIKTLADLAKRLPSNLSADWRDTNHFEIHDTSDGGDYFWLDLSDVLEYLRRQGSTDMPCETEHGKRVGLVMDCIEALSKSGDALNTATDQSRVIEVLRTALGECRNKWDTADNGKCAVCRIGFRKFDLKGNAQKCEWKDCLSHRIREALAEAQRIMEGK